MTTHNPDSHDEYNRLLRDYRDAKEAYELYDKIVRLRIGTGVVMVMGYSGIGYAILNDCKAAVKAVLDKIPVRQSRDSHLHAGIISGCQLRRVAVQHPLNLPPGDPVMTTKGFNSLKATLLNPPIDRTVVNAEDPGRLLLAK